MCGGLIDWCAFTWGAFATLVTGLGAVAGAVTIGLKQVRLQGLTVRSNLFDRRFTNYEAVRNFLVDILRRNGESDLEIQRKFFVARRESRFLFQIGRAHV